MIKHLSITNLLLIEKIEINIGSGLCVLTGETGAGKSMILDSLDLLSGRRIKPNVRPNNEKKTIISALIDIDDNSRVKDYLATLEIECEEQIIIKRIIDTDGKSKAMVNDNLVSLNSLKEITTNVIEVHSQFSEQGLLNNSTHLKTLDEFGDYKNKLIKLSKVWDEMKLVEEDFLKKKKIIEQSKTNLEIHKHDYDELKFLNPQKDEFIDLEKKKKVLLNSRKIIESLNEVLDNFNRENPPGIDTLISSNLNILNKIKDLLDSDTSRNIDKLNSILLDLSEISNSLQQYLVKDFENDSLEKIDDKVATYRRLALKHAVNPESLNEVMIDIKRKINNIEESQLSLNEIENQFNNIVKQYNIICKDLTYSREKNALIMDQKINQEFPSLKLENAKFKTNLEPSEKSKFGKDKVIFKIRTNPKSEMGEIKSISSGGELCRIALAIKVTAERNTSSTIVFDEVDSGIGGAVSTAVGERLRRLGNKRQVFVVTHSPQVASLGQNHFLVKKSINKNEVSILVKELNATEKVNEIARMLSGKNITNEAIKAATMLIESSK